MVRLGLLLGGFRAGVASTSLTAGACYLALAFAFAVAGTMATLEAAGARSPPSAADDVAGGQQALRARPQAPNKSMPL